MPPGSCYRAAGIEPDLIDESDKKKPERFPIIKVRNDERKEEF